MLYFSMVIGSVVLFLAIRILITPLDLFLIPFKLTKRGHNQQKELLKIVQG